MKSTYDLLGIHLDGVALPSDLPEIVSTCETAYLLDLRNDRSLFDYPICKRRISGNVLLSLSTFDDVDSWLENIDACKEIIVTLDYNSRSKTAVQLYRTRVLQAISALSAKYPTIAFSIAVNENECQDANV